MFQEVFLVSGGPHLFFLLGFVFNFLTLSLVNNRGSVFTMNLRFKAMVCEFTSLLLNHTHLFIISDLCQVVLNFLTPSVLRNILPGPSATEDSVDPKDELCLYKRERDTQSGT